MIAKSLDNNVQKEYDFDMNTAKIFAYEYFYFKGFYFTKS